MRIIQKEYTEKDKIFLYIFPDISKKSKYTPSRISVLDWKNVIFPTLDAKVIRIVIINIYTYSIFLQD